MLPLVIAEGVVIALLTVLVAGLLRSHAEILRTLHKMGQLDDEGAPIGDAAPRVRPRPADPVMARTISGVTPDGAAASISLDQGRGYTLLAFLSTGCTTCQPFWKGMAEQKPLPLPGIRTVVVTAGPDRESPAAVGALATAAATTIMSSEAWDNFRVPATPYFQLIDTGSGVSLGEGSAGSWRRLNDLIERAIGDDRHSSPRSTAERLRDSERHLADAGIDPDDNVLYRKPT